MLSEMVNRLTMALIVVGLYVGSSIVYFAGVPPIVFGIPVVGFMGYVVAFVLSVWIVFDIYFKGRRSRNGSGPDSGKCHGYQDVAVFFDGLRTWEHCGSRNGFWCFAVEAFSSGAGVGRGAWRCVVCAWQSWTSTVVDA